MAAAAAARSLVLAVPKPPVCFAKARGESVSSRAGCGTSRVSAGGAKTRGASAGLRGGGLFLGERLGLRLGRPSSSMQNSTPSVRPFQVRASSEPTSSKEDQTPSSSSDTNDQLDATSLASNVGLALLWAAFVAYAFTLSPNQTPYRDTYFLMKIVGLGEDDGVQLNRVFFCLFNIMGVWPGIYNKLLIPSARASGRPRGNFSLPAWPFIALSYGTGAFALLPYFALWRPEKAAALPSAEERNTKWFKGVESKITDWILLISAVGLVVGAATAGPKDWSEFGHFFDESRFIHVMTLDFFTLCCLAPFWVFHDADRRQYKSNLLWPLALTPLFGPAVYLVLRPQLPMAEDGAKEAQQKAE
eukprot:jgi/Chlat1/5297/Chrsp35S08979